MSSAEEGEAFFGGSVDGPTRPEKKASLTKAEAKRRFIRQLKGKERKKDRRKSHRPISTGKLNASPRLHLRPINLVVYKGPLVLLQGYLILRQASRLDAFSGYPFRTWLSCCAVGTTTGPPEVRPSRSSRTRNRPSQISYAHSR